VKLYRGRILSDRAVCHLRAARVRIETNPTAVIQADGQIVGQTPAEFSLLQRAIRVITRERRSRILRPAAVQPPEHFQRRYLQQRTQTRLQRGGVLAARGARPQHVECCPA